jgi:hypothetical protein
MIVYNLRIIIIIVIIIIIIYNYLRQTNCFMLSVSLNCNNYKTKNLGNQMGVIGNPASFLNVSYPARRLLSSLWWSCRTSKMQFTPMHVSRLWLSWLFRNMVNFLGEELSPHPTPKLEDHALSAVRDCLFNTYAPSLHIWRPFLHPQPKDAPCHGDRDPLITVPCCGDGDPLITVPCCGDGDPLITVPCRGDRDPFVTVPIPYWQGPTYHVLPQYSI